MLLFYSYPGVQSTSNIALLQGLLPTLNVYLARCLIVANAESIIIIVVIKYSAILLEKEPLMLYKLQTYRRAVSVLLTRGINCSSWCAVLLCNS